MLPLARVTLGMVKADFTLYLEAKLRTFLLWNCLPLPNIIFCGTQSNMVFQQPHYNGGSRCPHLPKNTKLDKIIFLVGFFFFIERNKNGNLKGLDLIDKEGVEDFSPKSWKCNNKEDCRVAISVVFYSGCFLSKTPFKLLRATFIHNSFQLKHFPKQFCRVVDVNPSPDNKATTFCIHKKEQTKTKQTIGKNSKLETASISYISTT